MGEIKMTKEKNESGEMAKIEGWEPHPTRKNIFIDQATGLLYRKTSSKTVI